MLQAALISSGASVVGIGSDYAGSIRLPCSFTGIFGHKTTPSINHIYETNTPYLTLNSLRFILDIVPRTMHFPNSTDPVSYDYFAIGPMCRYAGDLKPILEIICGEEGKCLDLNKPVNLSQIKGTFHGGLL